MTVPKKVGVSYKHEICEIFELAAKHGLDARFLELKRDGPIHNAIFTFRLTVGRFTAEAQGPTKVIARMLAAQQILPDLRNIPLPEKMLVRNSSKKSKLWEALPTFKPSDNPITCLHEIVTKWKGNPAKYTVDNVDRTFDPWVFYVRLNVAGETVVGAGLSKKEAKRNAASKVLNRFGYSFLYFEPENTKNELLLITQENSAPIPQGCLEVKHKDTCPEVSISQSHNRQDSVHMAMNLNKMVKEELIDGREWDISLEDLQKIGKTAAKQLVLEHGSGTALLKAAAEDTKAFEEDVVKHLKIELGAFLNRPKSVSARFFTRLWKAFCFC
uniref:DRBM domain-containing protein n=1 Tax=Neogobius melanostomus TaxID=47308 RepID=A0A8C6UYG2_9GOBI